MTCVRRMSVACCLFLSLIALLVNPTAGLSQSLFGDPSLTLGDTSPVKLEVGGGAWQQQKIIIDSASIRVRTTLQNVTWDVPEDRISINGENFFLKTTFGLGKMGDIFATIGQTRIKEPLDGAFSISGGGGLRLSPPQSGVVKVGLILQASYFSSKNDNISAQVTGTGVPDNGSFNSFTATGKAQEEITMSRYDAVIGFGIEEIPHVRPYGGVLISMIQGTDEISFSGTGSECTGIGIPCTDTTLSFSTKSAIRPVSSVGGIVGFTLNPTEAMGLTIESQFGISTSFTAAAFMRF